MTLKEQFQEWHDSPTNETVEENIIELEKIADEFAIEFAIWYKNYPYKGFKTDRELLRIFKEQYETKDNSN